MPVTVVVGAQWGDEGKAKVIDLLAAEHTHVVRYQGGHNAGHTMVVGSERYALQLIPSGVLYPHIIPVIGNGVVVDLPTLFKEIDTLQSRDIDCSRLLVSSQCHLIFPWHQSLDSHYEQGRGDDRIGTTLKGIGPAYADKARRIGVRAGDVLDPAAFANTVKVQAVAHNSEITALGGDALDVDAVVAQFSELGTYPFVTSSNPTAGGACVGTGIGPRYLTRIVGITKAYCTRVGSGPFPTELLDELGDKLVEIGHEYGTVTGRRRRCGWLDLVMLRKAVRINSFTELALTKLDVLDTFDEIKVCTEYDATGKPIYAVLPGWLTDISAVNSLDGLPERAKALVDLVEKEVGVPIRIVGTGAERHSYVVWQ